MSSHDMHTLSLGSDEQRHILSPISHSPPQFLDLITKACEAIVKEYQHSCISKAQASTLLLHKLSVNPPESNLLARLSENQPLLTTSTNLKPLISSDDQHSPTMLNKERELSLGVKDDRRLKNLLVMRAPALLKRMMLPDTNMGRGTLMNLSMEMKLPSDPLTQPCFLLDRIS